VARRKLRPCREPGCPYQAHAGVQRCVWHWLARQPLDVQEKAAQSRLRSREREPGYVYRARVKTSLMGDGLRWCAGCQSVIPLVYCSGSRCKACARRGARLSHVERTYEISREEYEALYRWQGGRCFVCGRREKSRSLAVDHDHVTGAVRGLLCSDQTFGCNVTLRRLLDDVRAAERLVAYAVETPLARMRSGAEPWQYGDETRAARDDGPPPF
jgi:hypothetical protein